MLKPFYIIPTQGPLDQCSYVYMYIYIYIYVRGLRVHMGLTVRSRFCNGRCWRLLLHCNRKGAQNESAQYAGTEGQLALEGGGGKLGLTWPDS